MNKTKISIFAGAAIVVAGALVFTITHTSTSTTDGQGAIGSRTPVAPIIEAPKAAVTTEVNPFTHVASIPATVDPSTIRFEKLKTVNLASKMVTTTDAQGCKDRQFREPDGTGCQSVKVEAKVRAVEATYSYVGPELSTAEGAPGRETFSVYFRPEEVGVDGPADKLKRDKAAAMFQINTFRPMTETKVVDKANSKYCEGKYVDGSWVQNDANCHDQVQYVSQTVPSANWTVQVDVRHPALASR